ncbi:ROK family protein [Amycolatopsis rhabdoformis]|uniref:ROK family protein n=1 Tax=Amycolatopsis rhabdoformis TaxID=1448059 RepID=A0ABZ1IJZ2_9PSEU|nr:ROK family protein [Amycolatopsis rhabdoformis]WSE34058.1 ROK family protein [Amycolatopsis rhabdoformis]
MTNAPSRTSGSGPSPSQRDHVLFALSRYGPMSRARLREVTGRSRTSVWSVVSDLVAEGSVVEDLPDPNARASHSGRPPGLLRLPGTADAVVGVDFGRTHIRAALADLSGRILAERQVLMQVDDFAAESLSAAAKLVTELADEAGIDRGVVRQVVVGLPAPVNRATGSITLGRVLNNWAGVVPATELEERIGIPVWLENNANLGALAEAWEGVAAGIDDVLYVKVSSGIGAGLVLNGKLYKGAAGIAGEIGHVLVDEDGPLCWCGSRGCLDTLASGRRIIELLQPTRSEPLTLERVGRLVRDGEPLACRIVSDAGRTLGRAIADLCASLNPGAVVLGGLVSAAGDTLADAVGESLRRYAQPAITDGLQLLRSSLGTRAEVVGAVTFALDSTRRRLAEDRGLSGLG